MERPAKPANELEALIREKYAKNGAHQSLAGVTINRSECNLSWTARSIPELSGNDDKRIFIAAFHDVHREYDLLTD